MLYLKNLTDRTNRIVVLFCAMCVLAMLSISFTGAIYQAYTGDSLSWTYSLARQFVPWIGMLSITVAFKSGEHVAVGMLAGLLPQRLQHWLHIFLIILVAIFAIVLVWKGTIFFLESTQLVMISDQIQISQRWVAACVPVTGLVMLVHLVSGRELFDIADEQTSVAKAGEDRVPLHTDSVSGGADLP